MAPASKMHRFAVWALYLGLTLVVLAFVAVSGVANVNVWFNSAAGWSRYVFTTIGVGSEVWGALGLTLLTMRFAQRQWIKVLVCFALWSPAVALNGYSTYRFFVAEGSSVQVSDIGDQTKLELASTRNDEITSQLKEIGNTRTTSAILLQRDALPKSYKTRRGELNAELSTAEKREKLEAELKTARQTIIDHAGAAVTETRSINDDWILAALAFWMEAIKALGIWVIFGKVAKAVGDQTAEKSADIPTPTNVTQFPSPNDDSDQEYAVGPGGQLLPVKFL